MKTTSRYGLKIPEAADVVDVGVIGGSLETIDTVLYNKKRVLTATLKAASWSGSAAPYTQTVAVSGMTAAMDPVLVSALAEGATSATQAAYQKAFARIAAGTATTAANSVTFKVYKKPATDITVGLKGD